jgi:hypothetical protein
MTQPYIKKKLNQYIKEPRYRNQVSYNNKWEKKKSGRSQDGILEASSTFQLLHHLEAKQSENRER